LEMSHPAACSSSSPVETKAVASIDNAKCLYKRGGVGLWPLPH
jgi:hypothetical protein